jgi:hypothetical protein
MPSLQWRCFIGESIEGPSHKGGHIGCITRSFLFPRLPFEIKKATTVTECRSGRSVIQPVLDISTCEDPLLLMRETEGSATPSLGLLVCVSSRQSILDLFLPSPLWNCGTLVAIAGAFNQSMFLNTTE